MISEDGERISEKAMSDLFHELLEESSTVHFKVMGEDYERLTMITGIEYEGVTPRLLIDRPRGFKVESRSLEEEKRKVVLSFSDKNKIRCTCTTTIYKISESDIWLELPEYIQRMQRRRHFRVTPFPGAKVLLFKEEKSYEGEVVDLSLVGALFRANSENWEFQMDEEIKDILLHSEVEETSITIAIQRSRIRRIEKRAGERRLFCALHFIKIDRDEESKLRDFIYYCQREGLKRRKSLSE